MTFMTVGEQKLKADLELKTKLDEEVARIVKKIITCADLSDLAGYIVTDESLTKIVKEVLKVPENKKISRYRVVKDTVSAFGIYISIKDAKDICVRFEEFLVKSQEFSLFEQLAELKHQNNLLLSDRAEAEESCDAALNSVKSDLSHWQREAGHYKSQAAKIGDRFVKMDLAADHVVLLLKTILDQESQMVPSSLRLTVLAAVAAVQEGQGKD